MKVSIKLTINLLCAILLYPVSGSPFYQENNLSGCSGRCCSWLYVSLSERKTPEEWEWWLVQLIFLMFWETVFSAAPVTIASAQNICGCLGYILAGAGGGDLIFRHIGLANLIVRFRLSSGSGRVAGVIPFLVIAHL